MVPKFHKAPIKFRPITNATTSCLKPLEIVLAAALKSLLNIIKEKKDIFIIDNNQPVLDYFNLNSNNFSVDTYDFSSLFTSIPLADLYQSIEELIDEFLGTEQLHLHTKVGTFLISPNHLKKMLHFSIYNNYVSWWSHIYHQQKGIPMGASYGPFAANLYLLRYELKYFKSHPLNKFLAFRYIDDILVINYPGFAHLHKQIYPQELEITSSGQDSKSTYFLDMFINIKPFYITLYDKRVTLKIPQHKLHFNSNIHTRVIKNTFVSDLLRISKICTKFEHLTDIILQNSLFWKQSALPKIHALKFTKYFCSKYKHILDLKYNTLGYDIYSLFIGTITSAYD